MDWSRIKTIFIIAFLTLDLFLASQLINKHQTNQFEMKTSISLEENLKDDEIQYDVLPKEPQSDQYVSAKTKQFSIDELKEFKDQKLTIENDTTILGTLDKPISLEKLKENELDSFVKANMLNGAQYKFWEYDQNKQMITYYQEYDGQVLFLNGSGQIKMYVNDDVEIDHYEQTYLEIGEPLNEPQEVATALKALETLYQKGELKPKSTVKKVELGYYTLVNMEVTQVLTPTWHFEVSDEDGLHHFLVNAYDLQIFRANISSENLILE